MVIGSKLQAGDDMAVNNDIHHADDNLRPAVGVGVMVRRGQKVLLGRRKGAHGAGTFGWPGGGLAFGETLGDAVRREALEEAGLKVKGYRYVCVSNVIEYGRHYIDFEVEVTDFDGSPVLREPDRVEKWEWFDLDNLPEPLFRPCQIAIKRLKEAQLGVVDADDDMSAA
jgi:8-oxo-dGTP diphosphatase